MCDNGDQPKSVCNLSIVFMMLKISLYFTFMHVLVQLEDCS